MKKPFYLSIIILLVSTQIYSQKQVNVHFDISDFSISLTNGNAVISTKLCDIKTYGDTLDPYLPYFPCRIIIPEEIDSVNYSTSMKKEMLYTDVRLLGNPSPRRYSERNKQMLAQHSVETPVHLVGIIDQDRYHYIYFKVTPFVYDQPSGKLCFVSEITINLPDLPKGFYNFSPNNKNTRFLNSESPTFFVNGDDIQTDIMPGIGISGEVHIGSPIEYLVITNSSLASSFELLKERKHNKAINTKIVTTDSIGVTYNGVLLADKIKQCVYDYYINHGTKWVLLGGDESIVPTKYCYINYGDNLAPADLYYACFNGNFEWDANRNGLPAELSDSVNFNPNVYVARVPVNTPQQVIDFTNKTIDYENGMMPNNDMLLAGFTFGGEDYDEYTSDAQQLSEMVYNQYISPYWNGNLYKLFDKSCDLPNGDTYYMTGQTLFNEIERGYNFIFENSHGNVTRFSVDSIESKYYTNSHANLQTNYPGSIFVTGACLTNKFDDNGLCLSEALLRNPNGGAVAYFGSSRWGYGSQNAIPSERFPILSDEYNGKFFSNLFRNMPYGNPRSFGAVAAKAKVDMIEESSIYTYNRELQLSINAMGDPEMQIYTETPKHFGTDSPLPIFSMTIDGDLIVNMNSIGCSISVLLNDGNKYITSNFSNVTLHHWRGKMIIQKMNYIPLIMDFSELPNNYLAYSLVTYRQGDNISFSITSKDVNNNMNVFSQVFQNPAKKWELSLLNAMNGEKMYSQEIYSPQRTINISGWPRGLYVVQAIIDGKVLSEKLIIQ